MANPWRVGCGGAGVPAGRGGRVELDLRPHDNFRPLGNVRLGIEAVRREFLAACPPPLLDLLEVATYVYVADQAAGRGRPDDLGLCWRRALAFRIPVRDPGRWSDPAVLGPLVRTLGFLSEDDYRFEFVPRRPDPPPGYFTVVDRPFDRPVDEVALFSGGLDSLAGAVDAAVVRGLHVLLVQHRSNPKLQPRHDHLVAELAARARARGGLVTHVPVVVNKDERLTADTTQRSRSFLFAALAAVVGAMAGRDRVRFYENGVVGLNLPLSPAVVGARATRTTHPRALAGFGQVLSAVAGRPIAVDSPFQWDTRTDVVRRLAAAGCADLIRWSVSCGGTRGMTTRHPHCGTCSQCVGRRFAVLAAGLEAHDPADGYRIDVLTGDRTDGDPRLVLAGFLDTVHRVDAVGGPAHSFALFGEAARILRAGPEPVGETAERVYTLYRRHARDVVGVLDRVGAEQIAALRRGELPAGCTLRLVFDTGPGEVVVPPPGPPAAVPAGGEPGPAHPPRARRPARKRGERAAKIERLVHELVEHLHAAREHALTTQDLTGTPALLPRPTQKALADLAGLTESDVSRCLKDPSARELRLYWETARDLDRILSFRGRVGGGSAA